MTNQNRSIGLCMIVKNEVAVIERCLASVRPWLDFWLIVDTGSTDGTQEKIREVMSDIPGELHERPWRNFAANRTEAVQLLGRRADYLFVIDADEILHLPEGFSLPTLEAGAYSLELKHGNLRYQRTCLVATALEWRYESVLHEYLKTDHSYKRQQISGPYVEYTTEGARSRNPNKYRDDAAVLIEALKDEPDNPRYLYYLAQSWRDAGELQLALDAYDKRAKMPGWEVESWHAEYRAAILAETTKQDDEKIIKRYLDVYNRRPTRVEPLIRLAAFFRLSKQYTNALMIMSQAMQIPLTTDTLFVEIDCYNWRRIDEYALALYWTGNKAMSKVVYMPLLNDPDVPSSALTRIRDNIAWCDRQNNLITFSHQFLHYIYTQSVNVSTAL